MKDEHNMTSILPAGGDFGSLQFFPRLSNRSPVPGPDSRLPRPRPRPLRAHLHPAAVLLLCWVAEGQREGHIFKTVTQYEAQTISAIRVVSLLCFLFRPEGCRAADQPFWRR